jgi:hypothetical protein
MFSEKQRSTIYKAYMAFILLLWFGVFAKIWLWLGTLRIAAPDGAGSPDSDAVIGLYLDTLSVIWYELPAFLITILLVRVFKTKSLIHSRLLGLSAFVVLLFLAAPLEILQPLLFIKFLNPSHVCGMMHPLVFHIFVTCSPFSDWWKLDWWILEVNLELAGLLLYALPVGIIFTIEEFIKPKSNITARMVWLARIGMYFLLLFPITYIVSFMKMFLRHLV